MSDSLFSSRVKALRTAYGLTQEGFAELIGISREQISKWENAKHAAPTKTVKRICEALGITEEQFWDPDWFPPHTRPINKARTLRIGPYHDTPINESLMALSCPRCGAADFSERARYCRQCAFPLYNYCIHPDMEARHINPPDARFCEVCTRPTFWSMAEVSLELIRGGEGDAQCSQYRGGTQPDMTRPHSPHW